MYGFTPVSYPLAGQGSYTPYYVKYDPNLKPQNTMNWEFGADLNFFDNRIRLEYTASYQDIKDQISMFLQQVLQVTNIFVPMLVR